MESRDLLCSSGGVFTGAIFILASHSMSNALNPDLNGAGTLILQIFPLQPRLLAEFLDSGLLCGLSPQVGTTWEAHRTER